MMASKNKDCYKITNNNYNAGYLSAAFFKGIFFSKNLTSFNGTTAIMSVTDQNDIVLAVKKAYLDMTPRTFKKNADWWKNPEHLKKDKNGKPKQDERDPDIENAWKQAKETVFIWLAGEFKCYFAKGCTDFDKWHTHICTEFLNKFSPELDKYGYDGKASLKYGKAQKIVNMTFKNLFCFDDAMMYIKRFDDCHMPIDSYILDWYNDNVSNLPNAVKYTKAWSDLSDKEYKTIQQNIKVILGTCYKPFFAEFYIWAEYNS